MKKKKGLAAAFNFCPSRPHPPHPPLFSLGKEEGYDLHYNMC
jgi:hypothetical protein